MAQNFRRTQFLRTTGVIRKCDFEAAFMPWRAERKEMVHAALFDKRNCIGPGDTRYQRFGYEHIVIVFPQQAHRYQGQN